MNKSQIIKKHLGDLLFEEGFLYKSKSNIWIFERSSENKKKEMIKQLIYVQKNNFGNDLYFRLHTNAYGQVLTDIPYSTYGKQVIYKYNTNNDFENIILEFAALMKTNGFLLLEQMCESIVVDRPTINQNNYLMQNKEHLIKSFKDKNELEISCDALKLQKVIIHIIKPMKNKAYTEVASGLIEAAAFYGEWIVCNYSGDWNYDKNHGASIKYYVNKILLTIYVLERLFLCWRRIHDFNEHEYKKILPDILQLK